MGNGFGSTVTALVEVKGVLYCFIARVFKGEIVVPSCRQDREHPFRAAGFHRPGINIISGELERELEGRLRRVYLGHYQEYPTFG